MGLKRLASRTRGFGRCLALGAASLAFCGLVAGCHGGDDDDKPPSCALPADARGSDACHAWQKAICDYAAKCGTLTQCSCIEQARAISCLSDDEATRCAQALPSASCTVTAELSGCDLANMADPAPAVMACQDYVSAVCSAEERCGQGSASDCESMAMGTGSDQIDCTKAIGAQPALDACINEIGTLSCSASHLPTSCDDALLLAN